MASLLVTIGPQCGSVKCEWSPAEINEDFLLIHSRMLFFDWTVHLFQSHSSEAAAVHPAQRWWRTDCKAEESTETPAPLLLLAFAHVVISANKRHAIWLSSLSFYFFFFSSFLSFLAEVGWFPAQAEEIMLQWSIFSPCLITGASLLRIYLLLCIFTKYPGMTISDRLDANFLDFQVK